MPHSPRRLDSPGPRPNSARVTAQPQPTEDLRAGAKIQSDAHLLAWEPELDGYGSASGRDASP